jgi:hypothetical protein
VEPPPPARPNRHETASRSRNRVPRSTSAAGDGRFPMNRVPTEPRTVHLSRACRKLEAPSGRATEHELRVPQPGEICHAVPWRSVRPSGQRCATNRRRPSRRQGGGERRPHATKPSTGAARG